MNRFGYGLTISSPSNLIFFVPNTVNSTYTFDIFIIHTYYCPLTDPYLAFGTNNCLQVCPSSDYTNINRLECITCVTGCAVCPDTSTCTTCSSGYTLNPSTKVCDSCPTNCDTCSSSTVCTLCSMNFFLNTTDNLCYSSCRATFFGNSTSRVC